MRNIVSVSEAAEATRLSPATILGYANRGLLARDKAGRVKLDEVKSVAVGLAQFGQQSDNKVASSRGTDPLRTMAARSAVAARVRVKATNGAAASDDDDAAQGTDELEYLAVQRAKARLYNEQAIAMRSAQSLVPVVNAKDVYRFYLKGVRDAIRNLPTRHSGPLAELGITPAAADKFLQALSEDLIAEIKEFGGSDGIEKALREGL